MEQDEFRIACAVSYTHLDVYKRQAGGFTDFSTTIKQACFLDSRDCEEGAPLLSFYENVIWYLIPSKKKRVFQIVKRAFFIKRFIR